MEFDDDSIDRFLSGGYHDADGNYVPFTLILKMDQESVVDFKLLVRATAYSFFHHN